MKFTPDYSSRFRILKGGKISLVVSALITGSTMTFASPTDGQVTTGSAAISQNGAVTTINQSTERASINWQSFNIAAHETVNFVQPSVSSVTLNRVIGTSQSLIEGAMNANGQVFLINPNGVLFANGSQVNVGGLVASTLNITDANFQVGNYVFEGNSQNSVLNMGTITASNGGYVAMMGKTVGNEGTIVATMGNVQMASGEKISLNLNGNSLVKLTIDQGILNALVENKGLIQADGGQVYLTTQALNTILDGMVNNTGVIEANTLNDVTGKVILFSHGGTANIGGTITAEGGFVETSGDKVKIADDVAITTNSTNGTGGTWLIDPLDFTIAASGGDITGAALGTLLTSNSIQIETATSPTATATNLVGANGTNGDIHVNDAISWSSTNDLTLNAFRNININENITSTDAGGKLILQYGQGAVTASNTATYNIAAGKKINLVAGQNFDTKLGSDGATTNWTVITALGAAGSTTGTDLQGIQNALTGKFVLGADIDASPTSAWNASTGFATIGFNSVSKFKGFFDGLGHTIDGLTINLPTTTRQGLFGTTDGATIRNIGLTNVSITGQSEVGGLVGQNYINGSIITNSYVTGAVSGTGANVGGLVGYSNATSSITDSYATATVSGTTVGGLVGYNTATSTITNSYATGAVSGTNNYIGGLVGSNDGTSSIINSYATGTVSGTGATVYVGGLVGWGNSGSVTNSYATGAVTGTGYTGGLVGHSRSGFSITNSYVTGAVNGTGNLGVGGLVGYNTGTSSITNSYTTGTVSGTGDNIGGLVGFNNATSSITNSYATGAVSGTNDVGGLVGYNTGTSTITKSYATGAVSGTNNYVGGLVGFNQSSDITNSYATGAVSGIRYIGGLVGNSFSNTSDITNSYATGAVSGTNDVGGLVGYTFDSPITNSFWDITTSGQATSSGGGTGKTTAEMKTLATFTGAGWDILGVDGVYPTLTFGIGAYASNIWQMDGITLLNYTLSTISTGYIYNGTSTILSTLWSPTALFGATYSSWMAGTDYLFKYGGNTVTGFTDAGTYSNISIDIIKSGFNEASSGNTNGNFTITKAPLTVTADNQTKVSGQANPALTVTVSGFVNSETALTSAGYSGSGSASTIADANTPAGPAVITASAGTLSATNYSFTNLVNGTLSISSAGPSAAELAAAEAEAARLAEQTATNQIVTTITNQTVVAPVLQATSNPIIIQPLTTSTPVQIAIEGTSDSFTLVSTTDGSQTVQIMTTEQLQDMNPEINEIRVILRQNSFVELINGGVRLPSGLCQEYYVVDNTNKEKKD